MGLNTGLEQTLKPIASFEKSQLYSHLLQYLNQLRMKNVAVTVKILCLEARRYGCSEA